MSNHLKSFFLLDPHLRVIFAFQKQICKQLGIYWYLPNASHVPGSELSPLFALAPLIHTSILGQTIVIPFYI